MTKTYDYRMDNNKFQYKQRKTHLDNTILISVMHFTLILGHVLLHSDDVLSEMNNCSGESYVPRAKRVETEPMLRMAVKIVKRSLCRACHIESSS